MNGQEQPIVKSALIVTIIAAVSRVMGLAREMVIAHVFGVGAITDAYAVAMRVVTTAGLLVAIYLNTVFVPTYTRIHETKGEKFALWVTNNALGVALVTNIFLMAVLHITAPLIIGFTGFDADQTALALIAVNIVLFQLPIAAFVHLYTGFLAARKSFIGPNAMGISMNIVFIAVCVISGVTSGVVGLSIAAVLGTAAQLSFLLFWLPKQKYRYQFSVKFNTPEIRSDARILVPALIGGGIGDIKSWVDTIIATHLSLGAPAAINFSARLLGFAQGMLIIPIAGMAYAYMSEYAAKNDISQMLKTLWQTVRIILFIVTPIVVIAIPSSFDIVHIVYQRGEFTAEGTLLTGAALRGFMPSLLGVAVHVFLIRFFYALRDTKTAMFCGLVVIIVNIVLSLWLSGAMGIGGLAFATSISDILMALLLLTFLRRKMGALDFGKTAIDILKMAVCAIPCVLAVLVARYFLANQNTIIRFVISAFAGGLAYLVAAFFVREIVLMDFIRKYIKNRFCDKP